MLENVDLTRKLSKTAYKQRLPALQDRLRVLQRAGFEADLATTVVLEGWEAAGKGPIASTLVDKLDPRGFRVRLTHMPTLEELYRPWLWRFWLHLPAYGQMVFFDRSWYSRVLVERVEKVAGKREVTQAFHEINEFERTLADDGQVLVKLFLHISRKEQVRRFKKWEKDPTQRWKVKPEIWRYARRYDDYLEAMEDMLEETSTTHAPWTIVEANDPRWATFEALTAVIVAMEAHLAKRGKLPRRESAAQARARRARDTTE